MKHVPWHVKGTRAGPRDAAGDATRRSGISITAAFAMIRKEIQELRRETSRPQVEPAAFGQQLNDLATQIAALQGVARGADQGPGNDVFLTQLKALLAQNLVALQQQVATTATDAISGPAESIRRDVASLKEIQASVDRRTQDTFDAVYGTIERIVDRLAAIEEELRERPTGPPSDGATSPPDEPPSADDGEQSDVPDVPFVRVPVAPGIAQGQELTADGAAVMLRQPAILPDVADETGPKQDPVKREPWRRTSSPARQSGGLVAAARQALAGKVTSRDALMRMTAMPRSRLEGLPWPLRPQWKTAVLGLGVALLMLFSVSLAIDLYRTPAAPAADPILLPGIGRGAGRPDERANAADPSTREPSDRRESSGDPGKDADKRPGKEPSRESKSTSLGAPSFPDGASVTTTGSSEQPVTAAPSELLTTAAASLRIDTSAPWDADALMRNVLLPTPPDRAPWPQAQSGPSAAPDATPFPPAIGGKGLVAAAQAGDPAAAYEIAIRFMQGRSAADAGNAAAWLERAAQAGFAPAQFRLGDMYEKGHGVRKNLLEARRLYLAAAGKGHPKAMHNLAVLYTHGVAGMPDYATAMEWFRKAASYGMVDSQYNLGILYARGLGVERDLAESYKWFALAAKGGDKEAARRCDEVAKGLDPTQLESAKANAEAFVTVPQPEDVTNPRAPAGGWDQAAAAATTKSRGAVNSEAKSERSPGK